MTYFLAYLFDLTLLNVNLTEPEQRLADKMTTYWSNFAKYGNPSPFITEGLPLWLPYAEKKVCLYIDQNSFVRRSFRSDIFIMYSIARSAKCTHMMYSKTSSDDNDLRPQDVFF
jgi:hypothetical protein